MPNASLLKRETLRFLTGSPAITLQFHLYITSTKIAVNMNLFNFLLGATLFISALTDVLRRINFGSITSLGLITVCLAFGTWLLVFARPTLPKAVLTLSSLVLFSIVTLYSWILHYSKLNPIAVIQNLSLYFIFVGFLLLSTKQSNLGFKLPDYISNTLPKATKLSVIFYGLTLFLGGPGTNIIMGARPFALFATIAVAWYLAAWRYRIPQGFKWSIITTVVVAFSFSRTALLTMLILFPLSQISLTSIKGWLRMGLTIFMILTISFLAFTYVEPIRSRFSEVGDNATVGGVQVNTSGRNTAWPVAYASALESPWIGKGPGSVGIILQKRVGPSFGHPHNDYLRIFHDYGLTGLILWIFGYLVLLRRTWKHWQWADRNDRANAHVHLAAFLALVAVAIAMISDNVIVYMFVMAPLGILVGASLGSGSRRKKVIKSHRRSGIASNNLRQLMTES